MFERLANWLVAIGSVSHEEREIVEFGLKQGASSLFGIIAAFLLAFSLGMTMQCFIFLLTFIPLRIYAGGYHAGTRMRCGIISFILLIGLFVLLRKWPFHDMVTVLIGMVTSFLITFIGPMDNKNKPMDKHEKMVYRRRGSCIIFIEVICLLVASLIGAVQVMETITVTFLMELLLLIWGKWQKQKGA